MKKIIYILLAFSFSLLTIYAQPSITWNRLYDGGFYDDDYGYGLCKTTDGNFVLGGYTPFHGAMVLKIDGYGNTIWKRHYIGSSGEAITATNDGGVLLASPTFLKINSSGDTVWLRSYPGNGINNLYDIIQCSDGGYLTCGRAYYDSGYVMKTDSKGNFLWKQIVSHPSLVVRMYAVNEAFSSSYIAAGMSYNLNIPVKLVLLKLDENGQRIWINFNEFNDSLGSGNRIIKLPPFYIISCGKGFMKVDDQGNVLTSKLVPLDFNDAIKDMMIISSNRFVILTNNSDIDSVNSKIRLIDTNGNTLNSQKINFSDFVRLKKIQSTGNGYFVFAGDAARYDTSQTDFYALRCDSNLNFPPIKVKKLSENVPLCFKLNQNFPNPFNPATKINYELPINSFVELAVYDILGREIEVLVNKKQQAGKYEVEWDARNFSSGIYFYRTIAYTLDYTKGIKKFVNTKKMILLK